MTLKELKAYVKSLPEGLDELEMVNGEMTKSTEHKAFMLVNKPIVTIYADVKNNELQFFHQSQEDIKNLLLDKS